MQIIQERIDVGMLNRTPKWIKWRGRIHKIMKIGLHHSYYEGRVLIHVFSVATETLFLKLKLDTASLLWKLEEIQNAV